MKILIVEHDALLLQGLILALEGEGYVCEGVATRREAETHLASGLCQLVILDLGLPDGAGLYLLSHLCHQIKRLPVLIITAGDAVDERIAGLEAGADDDIIKPFSNQELLARVHKLTHSGIRGRQQVVVDDLRLEMKYRQIFMNDRALEITPKEYVILARLMMSVGNPVHRDTLCEDIYQRRSQPTTNVLEVHIHNLREKIGKERIRTVRSFGYALIRQGEKDKTS